MARSTACRATAPTARTMTAATRLRLREWLRCWLGFSRCRLLARLEAPVRATLRLAQWVRKEAMRFRRCWRHRKVHSPAHWAARRATAPERRERALTARPADSARQAPRAVLLAQVSA